MTRNKTQTKVQAMGLVVGIGNTEWEEYLLSLIGLSDPERLYLDWENASYPLPKQLKNPAVAKELPDGTREYMSSQLWLRLNKNGEKELLIPDETSGVLFEGDTGKVLKGFNCLPMVTPRNTDYLIRILIREQDDSEKPLMNWQLYTNYLN